MVRKLRLYVQPFRNNTSIGRTDGQTGMSNQYRTSLYAIKITLWRSTSTPQHTFTLTTKPVERMTYLKRFVLQVTLRLMCQFCRKMLVHCRYWPRMHASIGRRPPSEAAPTVILSDARSQRRIVARWFNRQRWAQSSRNDCLVAGHALLRFVLIHVTFLNVDESWICRIKSRSAAEVTVDEVAMW